MTKKYILKPGKHQFAPRSHAVHENDNLSDEEAEWYLERYPHIASLFEDCLEFRNSESLNVRESPMIEITPDDQSSQNNGLLNQ
jgi:hypothetical protein